MKKLYLYKRSITAHESMNNTFMRGMTEHWGPQDIHLSCDTAIARGVPESRLEIPSMVTWDAFIGDRQIHELCLVPRLRRYHRYLPFPPSVQQSLDEWSRHKLKISLHHQLLTGVVIYIDPREFKSEELDSMESSVVHKRVLLLAPGHYWRNEFNVTSLTAADSLPRVEAHFEKLWEARRGSKIMKLYYKYPDTFLPEEHYIPNGIRQFLAYVQNYRCVCQKACNLNCEKAWASDHILPRCKAGTNVLINLQASCREYNTERKRERLEARTVSYPNVMGDERWKPVVSPQYEAALIDQRCNETVLTRIRSLNKRQTQRVMAQLTRT